VAVHASTVPMFYDPLVGKLVALGEDREASLERMSHALEEMEIEGIRSNVPALLGAIGTSGSARDATTRVYSPNRLRVVTVRYEVRPPAAWRKHGVLPV
jgi:acetyl/propionyl-CoA carboxylase alpha subunit